MPCIIGVEHTKVAHHICDLLCNPGDIVNFCILSHIYIRMSELCSGPLKRVYSDPKNVLHTKYRNMYSYKNKDTF